MVQYRLSSYLINGVGYPPNAQGNISLVMKSDISVNSVYTLVSQTFTVTVQTSPINIPFTVLGVSYPTRTAFSMTPGASITITVPARYPDPSNPNFEYRFTNWSNGETGTTRTISNIQSNFTPTAYYSRKRK